MIEKNISTNENLVQDISNELIFGHTHNGVKCAVCPTANRACDRAWFSAKQIENWSGMSTTTLWRRLNDLEECERISRLQDFANVNIPTETGAVKTTLYNLNVLNQLAMVEMKNKVLNDTAKKFSDILSEVETTGSYSVNQTQNQPAMLPNFCNPAEAARAWADLYEKNQATELRALTAESERDETKVLLAEEREYYDMLSEAVDDLVRTTARVSDKKGASDLGTAGAKSKESEEAWMTARDWCLKHKLPVSTNEPEWTVSKQLTDICMTFPKREQWHRDSSDTKLFPQWACNILDKVYCDDSIFLLENRKV